MPKKETKLRKAIGTYLDGLHSTTWGRMFTVIRPDTRELAIDYIEDLMRKVNEIKKEQKSV